MLRGPADRLTVPSGTTGTSLAPAPSHFQKRLRPAPQRALPAGTRVGGAQWRVGEAGAKPEAAEAGEAPPAPSSPLLGVFAVSPAGAGAARSQER